MNWEKENAFDDIDIYTVVEDDFKIRLFHNREYEKFEYALHLTSSEFDTSYMLECETVEEAKKLAIKSAIDDILNEVKELNDIANFLIRNK